MPSTQIVWDQQSVVRFEAALKRQEAVVGKGAADTVQYGFLRFCISGRANTRGKSGRGPHTEAKRAIVPNPAATTSWLKSGKRPAKWLIRYLYQNKPPQYWPARRRDDKRRLIGKRRGLAKSSWGWMMQALFPSRVTPNSHGVSKRKVMAVKDGTKKGTDPFVEFHDKLVYLLKVHPDIGSVAMDKAANYMQKRLDQRMAQEMVRAWHS